METNNEQWIAPELIKIEIEETNSLLDFLEDGFFHMGS